MSWAFDDDDCIGDGPDGGDMYPGDDLDNLLGTVDVVEDDDDALEGFDLELESMGLLSEDPNQKQTQAFAGSGYNVARMIQGGGSSGSNSDSNSLSKVNSSDSLNGLNPMERRDLFLAEQKQQMMQPLPLIHFQTELDDNATKTIFASGTIKNYDNDFADSPNTVQHRKLHDAHRSILLQNYFTALSSREVYLRENAGRAMRDDVCLRFEEVYTDKLFDESTTASASERTATCSSSTNTITSDERNSTSKLSTSAYERRPVLQFDGEFESGNIEKAVFVTGRDKIRQHVSKMFKLGKSGPYVEPMEVDLEYDITVRNDIYTQGNIQWFYFKVIAPKYYGNEASGDRHKVKYPLKVRFQLVNMEKKDSLYNYGMRPVSRSEKNSELGWVNAGEDVCYFKNGRSIVKKVRQKANPSTGSEKSTSSVRKFVEQYSTIFTYVFDSPDTMFFAHAFPYTYSDLQRYLHSLEQDERIRNLVRRKSMCSTLAGNRCDLLTITGPCTSLEESNSRPSVIISARVHPGETNSSYMMHGMIEFLVSENAMAVQLRQHFVFKVVPMLNPDGVIHGNYRCSLAGADLNRKYLSDSKTCYPTIIAMRNLIKSTQNGRGVSLYLDLHGHSKKKNAFVYGCDVTYQPEKTLRTKVYPNMSKHEIESQRVYSRLYPYMLSRISETVDGPAYFNFSDCCFTVGKSKAGTGRVFGWAGLEVEAAYTIELSFCGPGNNKECKILRKADRVLENFIAVTADCRASKDATTCPNAGTSKASFASTSTAASIGEDQDAIEVDFSRGSNSATKLNGRNLKGKQKDKRKTGSGLPNENEGRDQTVINDKDKTSFRQTKSAGGKFAADNGNETSSSATAVPFQNDAILSLTSEALQIRALLESYSSLKHYGKSDLTAIGTQAAQTIYYFCNLDRSVHKVIPAVNSHMASGTAIGAVTGAAANEVNKGPECSEVTVVAEDPATPVKATSADTLDTSRLRSDSSSSACTTATTTVNTANNRPPSASGAVIVHGNEIPSPEINSSTQIAHRGLDTCERDQLLSAQLYPSLFSNVALIAAINNDYPSISTTAAGTDTDTNTDISTNADTYASDTMLSSTTFTAAPMTLSPRLQAEISIRKMLKMWDDSGLLENSLLANIPVEEFVEFQDDDGSDSDPSVNDISEKFMSKMMNKKKCKRKADILLALQKAARLFRVKAQAVEVNDDAVAMNVAPKQRLTPPDIAKRKVSAVNARSRQAFPGSGAGNRPNNFLATYRLDDSPSNMYDPLSQLAAAHSAKCTTVDLNIIMPDGALVPSLNTRRKKNVVAPAPAQVILTSTRGSNTNNNGFPIRRGSFESLVSMNSLTSTDNQYTNAIAAATKNAANTASAAMQRVQYAETSKAASTSRTYVSKTSAGRM